MSGDEEVNLLWKESKIWTSNHCQRQFAIGKPEGLLYNLCGELGTAVANPAIKKPNYLPNQVIQWFSEMFYKLDLAKTLLDK